MVKKLLKLRFLDYFSKAKTEQCDQEDWIVSGIFEIITSCWVTYHLVVGGPVSLNVATKASFGGQKTLKSENLKILKNWNSKFWGYFWKAKTE